LVVGVKHRLTFGYIWLHHVFPIIFRSIEALFGRFPNKFNASIHSIQFKWQFIHGQFTSVDV